jgi:antitoxin PrlF
MLMVGYAKVSSKGQITLSAEVRKRLKIEPGSYLCIVADEEGIYLTPVKESISQLRGAVAVEGVQDFKKIRRKTMEVNNELKRKNECSFQWSKP